MVYFFTKGGINVGSSRQRAYFVAEKLSQNGFDVKICRPSLTEVSVTSWPKKFFLIKKIIKIFFIDIKNKDLVFIHKGIYNKYFLITLMIARLFKKFGVISDFDDAVFSHSPYKTRILISISDVVLAGSHYIMEWMQLYHNNVYLLPTSIDFSVYSSYTKNYFLKNNQPLVIGWVGHGPDHYSSLRHLPPIFKKILSLNEKFSFTLVGSLGDKRLHNLFNINGLKTNIIDNLDWSNPKNVAQEIQKFDIGIMPLENLEIEKGKCSFKAIEYMACGVATIASDIGENKYIIRPAVNGFLANNEEEWVKYLVKLLDEVNLRQQLGKAGQDTVYKRYSFERTIPQLIDIIRTNF